MLFCNFYVIYKLREVFTYIKMSIITEASKSIFEDRFDVRKGQNLKMHLNMLFKDPRIEIDFG